MKQRLKDMYAWIAVALLLLVVDGSGRAVAQAIPSPPDELGPYGVGRTTIVFHDQSRNRDLATDIWYPTQATTGALAGYRFQAPIVGIDVTVQSEIARQDAPVANGLFGLVMFSHANLSLSIQSFFLTEALASHGFIVVAPNHTGNTLLDLGQPTQNTEIFSLLADRPRDLSFLITAMLAKNTTFSDPFFAKINPLHIGVTGHSAGGHTAFLMAAGFSGRFLTDLGLVPPPNFTPVPPDSRVEAIFPMSAGFPNGLTTQEMSSIGVSTLLIAGVEDEQLPVESTALAYDLIGANRKMASDILNAFHFSFANTCKFNEAIAAAGQPPLSTVSGPSADLPCQPGALPIEEVHRIVNLYAVAFSRYTLSSELSNICFLTEGYAADHEPSVQFRRKPDQLDDALAFSLCNP